MKRPYNISLTEEYIAALENSPLTGKIWRLRTTMITMDTPEYTKQFLRNWKAGCYEHFWFPVQQEILDGTMHIMVVGIPDEFFGSILDSDLNEIGAVIRTAGFLSNTVLRRHIRIRTEAIPTLLTPTLKKARIFCSVRPVTKSNTGMPHA